MCLEVVQERIVISAESPRIGYKVFHMENGRCYSLFRKRLEDYQVGCVHKARGVWLNKYTIYKYKSGFHCFNDEMDARRYMVGINNEAVFKIKFWGQTNIGTYNGCEAISSEYMEIIPCV